MSNLPVASLSPFGNTSCTSSQPQSNQLMNQSKCKPSYANGCTNPGHQHKAPCHNHKAATQPMVDLPTHKLRLHATACTPRGTTKLILNPESRMCRPIFLHNSSRQMTCHHVELVCSSTFSSEQMSLKRLEGRRWGTNPSWVSSPSYTIQSLQGH